MAGWLPLFAPASGLSPFSQRSLFNLSYINDVAHYPFINHVLEADNWPQPYGGSFSAVNPSWPELLDITTGYPNSSTASGHEFGGGLKFPDSSKFAGPYVITWTGTGTVGFKAGTWTETNNTGTTYTRNSNGNWSSINGQTPYIIANLSGWAGAPNILGLTVQATGGADGFVKNVKVYRLADETDLLAGKVYRAAFKQQILDHNPSCIRVMDWASGNNDQGMRFENRNLPSIPSYGTAIDMSVSPIYGTTSGSARFTLPAVSTGTRQTPASEQHGETATFRIGTRFTGGPSSGVDCTVTAITTGATPRVTTNNPHNYAAGNIVVHQMPSGNGMPNLDRFPCTITVINSTQYDITNFNSTGMTFVANGTRSLMYVSLKIGTTGRTEYPIFFHDGFNFASIYGDDGTGFFLKAGNIRTMYFDKTVNGISNGSGTYTKGAWLFDQNGADINGHWDGVPLEILTKLFVELNAVSTKPISMWMNFPHRGMSSIDPDYTSASNFAVKATDIILNGSTVGGVTYPGLKLGAPRANLYIEYCNELWNFGPYQGYWMDTYSKSRWGSNAGKFDGHMLKATAMARDIKAAYPSESQIKILMGMFAAGGMTAGGTFANYYSWNGNSTAGDTGNYYTTDTAYVLANSLGPPKNYFDGIAIAPYFDAPGSYWIARSGTGTFVDDSAMYNGINNSGAASYTATISGTTMTVTAISTNSVLNIFDSVTGSGVTSGTTITSFGSGQGGTGTYNLSTSSTVVSPATMTGPAHGGGNYTSAANQSQALSNFVTKTVTDTVEGLAYYASIHSQFTANMGDGQFVCQYEGGPNWTTLTGALANGVYPNFHQVTVTDTPFLVASYHYAGLGTGIVNYMNTICAQANTALPALFLSVNSGYRWTFSAPDSYDVGSSVEGSGLSNNPAWTAVSTRNASVT